MNPTSSSNPRSDPHDPVRDVVELDMPLHHRHASTVRVVAASLAADAGFSVDEIEELRLGVDEAVSVMADVSSNPQARLHLQFELSGEEVTVTVMRSGVVETIGPDDVDHLATRILSAVVDGFAIHDGVFELTKRVAGAHVHG